MCRFSLRCTKMHLAAGLCLYLLGELTVFPQIPYLDLGMGKGEDKDRQGRDGERGWVGEGKGRWGWVG